MQLLVVANIFCGKIGPLGPAARSRPGRRAFCLKSIAQRLAGRSLGGGGGGPQPLDVAGVPPQAAA